MADARKPDEWLPLHIGDYQADTQHLTRDQHGAYLLLLMAYWRRGGALPADDGRLAAIAKATPAEWRRLKPIISEFFSEHDGTWFNKRSEEELAKARAKVAARSEAGKKGAAATWQTHGKANGKTMAMPEANAADSHRQNDGPLPSTSRKEESFTDVKPKKAEERGSRVPEDFWPNPTSIAKADRLNIPVNHEFVDGFMDYWRSVPGAKGKKLDWDATFRNHLDFIASRKHRNGTAQRYNNRDSFAEAAEWFDRQHEGETGSGENGGPAHHRLLP